MTGKEFWTCLKQERYQTTKGGPVPFQHTVR
jgi:hypothetical protein